MIAYVFGYASLVELYEPAALPGRLRGYRRCWGVAMNNWEGGDFAKHWLDESGERPRIRVAYLDIEPSEGRSVNGVAIPVDADRLTALDLREVNYLRIDVSTAFEPSPPLAGGGECPGRVFAYIGRDAARERCRQGAAEGDICVSRSYFAGVRHAFALLSTEALAEFDRTTEPLPFPERDLQVAPPDSMKD